MSLMFITSRQNFRKSSSLYYIYLVIAMRLVSQKEESVTLQHRQVVTV